MTDQAARGDLRDPRPLWSWFRVFLVLHALLVVVLTASGAGFTFIGGLDPRFTPRGVTEIAISLSYFGSSILMLIIYAVCIFLTCRLTFRMMKNLHLAGSGYVSTSAGWAVGSYFIPFLNLVIPVRAVGEIWRGTFAEVDGPPPKDPEGAIGWWWGPWILSNILDNIGTRMQGTSMLGDQAAVPQQQAMAGMAVLGIGSVLSIIATIFMFLLFQTLVRAQSRMVNAAAMT